MNLRPLRLLELVMQVRICTCLHSRISTSLSHCSAHACTHASRPRCCARYRSSWRLPPADPAALATAALPLLPRPMRFIMRFTQLLYAAHVLACLWFLITLWVDDDEVTWLEVYDGCVYRARPSPRTCQPYHVAVTRSHTHSHSACEVHTLKRTLSKHAYTPRALPLRASLTCSCVAHIAHRSGSAVNGPVSEQYFFSFYWGLTVVTALNPISPNNDTERRFQLVVGVLNKFFFAYIIGRVTGLLNEASSAANAPLMTWLMIAAAPLACSHAHACMHMPHAPYAHASCACCACTAWQASAQHPTAVR
jgi:hypothetical protein